MSLLKKLVKWMLILIVLSVVTAALFGTSLSPLKLVLIFLNTFSAA